MAEPGSFSLWEQELRLFIYSISEDRRHHSTSEPPEEKYDDKSHSAGQWSRRGKREHNGAQISFTSLTGAPGGGARLPLTALDDRGTAATEIPESLKPEPHRGLIQALSR